MEWVRFAFCAICMLIGLVSFAIGTFGIYKFKFVLNRMHSAAILDTMGLFFVALGLVIALGFNAMSLKLVLIFVFLWMTGPISSHLLAKMEFFTDDALDSEIKNDLSKVKGGNDNDSSPDL